jgi:hypothetical protein
VIGRLQPGQWTRTDPGPTPSTGGGFGARNGSATGGDSADAGFGRGGRGVAGMLSGSGGGSSSRIQHFGQRPIRPACLSWAVMTVLQSGHWKRITGGSLTFGQSLG